MSTTYGRKLACTIIQQQFGDEVEKVCKCLVNRGKLTLNEIARGADMAVTQLSNCLLVLIQHNCVQAFQVLHEAGSGPARSVTAYIALIDNIIHRMRFPKFLMLVKEELGVEAESLVEGLLEHGRLTLEQVIQRASERDKTDMESKIKEVFAKLAQSRYIERCPIPEPVLSPKDADEQPKKRKARMATIASTEESRVLAAATVMEAERFRIPASVEESRGPSSSGKDIEGENAHSGVKRKRDALEMDKTTLAIIDEKEVLWRMNYEELIRRLRHKKCISQVKLNIDDGASVVLSAMLQTTKQSEKAVREKLSSPLSMDAITQAVRQRPEGRTMTMERIRAARQQMSSGSGFICEAADGSGYAVDMQTIIENARQSEVEGIVLQRFGGKCSRIFRLLAMKGLLEQKQISDRTLVPVLETWELLYKLLKEEYVQLQSIPKGADHAPQKTFYLWRVNTTAVEHHILDDMYHAAHNLFSRLSHELEQEQEVISLVNQAASAEGSHVTISKSQHDQFKRIRNIATVLETSLMRLDETIMLFHDF